MNSAIEENDHIYVSPADFDEPGTPEADVKSQDETDLPVLEEVMRYLAREMAKTTHVDSLEATEDTASMTLEQRWAVQREISRKLGLIRLGIQAVIEGIEEKYDETRG